MVAEIRRRLEAALSPTTLEVLDEGDRHAGHAHAGQGHYRVRIASPDFAGVSPLRRHRMVYAALDDLLQRGVHALAIEAQAIKS